MGFSKANYRDRFDVVVLHPQHPGDSYVFTFPKKLPQAALDAEKAFLALGDAATADDWRKALINVIAEMMTRDPEGFDDFPREPVVTLEGQRAPSLTKRAVEYFDDPEKPELEAIIIKAWKEYKAAAVP